MTIGRRVLTVVAATLIVLGVTTGSTVAAQDAPITDEPRTVQSWALGPTGSADPSEPGNRQAFVYDVAPGSVIEDSVTLYNFGTTPLSFRVYATDAFNQANGAVDLLPGDQAPTDVGSWVEVLEERLALQPGTQATIPITIRVPADATPGDHVGAIVASAPTTGRGPNGMTLEVDRRTGPDLRVRVQGPLRPEVSVDGLSASYRPSVNPLDGTAEVTYTIRNTGNVRLEGTHHVSLAGPFGLGETTTPPVRIDQLLPGGTVEVRVPVDGVPASVLSTATVHLETKAADGGEAEVTETASATALALPVSLLALAVVVGLVLVAVSRYRRRGRAASTPVAARAVPSPVGAPGGPSGPGARPSQVLEVQR